MKNKKNSLLKTALLGCIGGSLAVLIILPITMWLVAMFTKVPSEPIPTTEPTQQTEFIELETTDQQD